MSLVFYERDARLSEKTHVKTTLGKNKHTFKLHEGGEVQLEPKSV